MSASASSQGVVVEHCAGCGRDALLPRGFCARCGSKQVAPRVISGEGSVWSVTTLHRPAHSGSSGPTIIALVDLIEGPRVMIRAGAGPVADLLIGTKVELTNSALGEPPRLVRALPA